MNISKEVKVGLLGIIGLVLLYYGFNFLKGSDIFSSTKDYRLTFKDVMGLEVSNTVNYKGVVVGRVAEITPDYDNGKIDVIISVKKGVKVTSNTEVVLADDGLVGGKLLILNISPGELLPADSELKTNVELGMLSSITEKLDPTLRTVDSLMQNLNTVVKGFENSGQALQILLASAHQSTTGLNAIMAANSKNLSAITGNTAALTLELNKVVKDLDGQLKPILANATTFTDSLKVIQLASTVQTLNGTIAQLQGVMKDINEGEGTIGKLTSNDSLYNNLNNTAESLNNLLVDFKESPRRYVHFSLFGRKDKTKKEEAPKSNP